jgi:hypothetical protein
MLMGKHAIASIINFCTNDIRFLDAIIKGAKIFSEQLFIVVCDHFFDGRDEDFGLLEWLYKTYPDCIFIEFPFDVNNLFVNWMSLPAEHDIRHLWHNTGKLISYYFLDPTIDYVLYLDADEILDGDKFKLWLDHFDYRSFDALRFSSYWYFRESCYQATTYADTALLIKKDVLEPEHFLDPDERMGIFHGINGRKQGHVLGLDMRPMVHHFSWVRTKEEFLKKSETWAHYWERDWKSLIEDEFSKEFTGVDFVRGYKYIKIEPYYDPFSYQIPKVQAKNLEEHLGGLSRFPNVRRVGPSDLFKMDLTIRFDLA